MTQLTALELADALEEPVPGFPLPTRLETAAAAELRRLHAEVEALMADAKRYRWLRNEVLQDGEINEEIHVAVDSESWPDKWALVGADLDKAIDAAIAKGEGTNV